MKSFDEIYKTLSSISAENIDNTKKKSLIIIGLIIAMFFFYNKYLFITWIYVFLYNNSHNNIYDVHIYIFFNCF